LSNTGSNASVGPGASSFVSNGVDSIHSAFLSSDTVLMEWDVELLGFGPSNNRGPEVLLGRDLDGDGILENANQSPADAGYEGHFQIKINYDRIDIRYNQLDASGIATPNAVIESINFATTDTNLHCEIQIEQVNSHTMGLSLTLSGQSGIAVEQAVVLDFVGPHRWAEIDGVIIRTDNCCSKVDNIVFTPIIASAVQWRVQDGGNGHWYAVTNDRYTDFWVAQDSAEQLGGHLVTITSQAENLFVADLSLGNPILGGYQSLTAPDYSEPLGGWRWVTGEDWLFEGWRAGEPNNANINGENVLTWWRFEGQVTSAEWNDAWTTSGIQLPSGEFALVEWSADCNGDGIVDYGQILAEELPDANGNGVPDGCELCPADLDGNGQLDFFDVSGFLLYFQIRNPIADFTGDGSFDFFDVSAFLTAFSAGCPYSNGPSSGHIF